MSPSSIAVGSLYDFARRCQTPPRYGITAKRNTDLRIRGKLSIESVTSRMASSRDGRCSQSEPPIGADIDRKRSAAGGAEYEIAEVPRMKLLRWAVGGASAYVIYRYSIGRKAKGEDVFVSPEKEIEKLAQGDEQSSVAAAKPKRTRKPPAK